MGRRGVSTALVLSGLLMLRACGSGKSGKHAAAGVGGVLSVLSTHGHSYLKVSPGFLRIAQLPAAACRRFCGKYLQYPAARARDLFAHVNMDAVTRAMAGTPAHEVKLFGAVTIAGQLAWLLQDSHEDSLYIAAHGRPYVLRAIGPPPGLDAVNLTQWDAVRIPAPRPPASSCIPVSSPG